MRTHIFEAQSRQGNWGKFLVGEMDTEWEERSVLGDRARPLLTQCGWAPGHLWVMDMQTFEGAAFRHGGHAKADLDRHRIWVCPLFEPFLTWLYTQDAARLGELDQLVTLDAPLALAGYRRSGGTDEVDQALYAADSGQAGDWTMVAWILADKVRELQAVVIGLGAAFTDSAKAACCDLHGRNCEPPSELCCEKCTESHHNGMTTPDAPYHSDGTPCSNPDLSGGR